MESELLFLTERLCLYRLHVDMELNGSCNDICLIVAFIFNGPPRIQISVTISLKRDRRTKPQEDEHGQINTLRLGVEHISCKN
jgi:hypothetical protein